MLIAFDIGNTNITLGVFDNGSLVNVYRLPTNIHYSSEYYADLLNSTVKENVTECIIASVVNGLDVLFADIVKSIYGVNSIVVNSNIDYGIDVGFDNNGELGADRVANTIAAHNLYTGTVIVVDFGTANTFDVIDTEGKYIGGLIAPGINIQLNSLSKCTSKLPNLTPEESDKIIGTNTTDSIMSGVIRGTACMVDGMLYEYEKELNCSVTTVITGGLGNLISKYMKHTIDDINPNLTLLGLRELFVLNESSLRLLR